MLLFLLSNNIFLVRFGHDILRPFLRFPKNFRDILPDYPQTEELDTADEQNDTNGARPTCHRVTEHKRTDKYDKQGYHGNNGKK